MSNLAKLKKKAAEFEQKRQFERALATYEEVLRTADGGEDADVALHNRVGDLQLRLGHVAEALQSYERAVDLYAERGFLNNAIALCNKILRQDPSRAAVHYKLGRACAAKGFRGDARQHFVTYAELMQRAGRLDDALSALQECADLAEAQDDLRLLLADQLARHDRVGDALAQLRLVLARAEAEHRRVEAEEVRARIRALDPDFAGSTALTDDSFPELPADTVARPSGPRTRPVVGGAAPDLVLFEPTEFGARRSGEPERGTLAGWEPTASADQRGGRLSGGVLMPEELIRGADVDPTPRPAALRDEPYSLADLAPDAGVFDAPALGEGTHAPELYGADAFAADSYDSATDGLAAAEELALETFEGYDGPAGERLELMPAPAEEAGASPLASESAADFLLDLDAIQADAADAVAFAPAAQEEGADGSAVDEDLDFALPWIEAPADAPSAPSATPTGVPAVATDDELLAFSLELDGAAPSEEAAGEPAAAAGAELDGWIVSPDEVAQPGWHARLASARASLVTGDVESAVRAVAGVLAELDGAGEMQAADAALDELVELAPRCLPLHEQRVARFAARGLTARIVAANLALAGAARAVGQEQLARVAYARVLEVAPGNAEASAVLGSMAPRELPRGVRPVVPTPVVGTRAIMPTPIAVRPIHSTPIGTRPVEPPPAAVGVDFVNLGDLLRDEGPARSTRMVVEERAPTGDEQADFAAMLTKFKQGVAENVDHADYDSHYDLGVAYKEMGLVDEAIASFQRALRGTRHRARTYEALGLCFIERGQFAVAAAVLQRATQEPGLDDHQLVGVLYLLGRAAEAMNQRSDALRYYERVLAVDITFSDVAERMGAVEQVGT